SYLEACVDRFGIRGDMRFNTRLVSAAWDDQKQFWRIETADGKKLTARALVSAMGGLHVPNVPDIPGLKDFGGPVWHSAQWRDDVDLKGKRVAMIGSGASAIQITPEIAPIVEHLDLYQRTPNWIVPKADRAVGADEQAWFKRAPWLQEAKRRFLY